MACARRRGRGLIFFVKFFFIIEWLRKGAKVIYIYIRWRGMGGGGGWFYLQIHYGGFGWKYPFSKIKRHSWALTHRCFFFFRCCVWNVEMSEQERPMDQREERKNPKFVELGGLLNSPLFYKQKCWLWSPGFGGLKVRL